MLFRLQDLSLPKRQQTSQTRLRTWNNGNYYLLAYLSDKQDYRPFRVDRMEDIQVLFAKREGVEGFNATQYLGNKKAKVFGMYGGRIERVTLQCINKVADQIVDEFGKDLMMVELFDKEHFQVNVVVEISPTFFAWVSTFGKQMQITNPPSVVEEMKAFVSKLSEMYR